MPLNLAENVPTNLYEAVDLIVKNLDDSERKYFATKGSIGLHHGFGMALRNNWGLWTGSKLKDYFKDTYGLGHADDMSGMILDAVEARVLGRSFIPATEAERYRKYWLDNGIDPLTQEKVK